MHPMIGTIINVPEKYDVRTRPLLNSSKEDRVSLSKIMEHVRRQKEKVEKPQRERSNSAESPIIHKKDFIDQDPRSTTKPQDILELQDLAASLMPPKIAQSTYEPPNSKYCRRRSSTCSCFF
mmetsp:Transcript_29047/g.43889  ORF Transcript_29047/g.43889 Transcript_29047/m.43889 type:complete len:122 (-) Transcript_29047:190-555(-)